MKNIILAIIYGVLEGITEWLPISSTGHLLLLEQWLPLNASENFKDMFFIVIQFGAILAVVRNYFKKLNPFQKGYTANDKKRIFCIHLYKIFATFAFVFSKTYDNGRL